MNEETNSASIHASVDGAFPMLYWQAGLAILEASARFAGWAVQQRFSHFSNHKAHAGQMIVPPSLSTSEENLFA